MSFTKLKVLIALILGLALLAVVTDAYASGEKAVTVDPKGASIKPEQPGPPITLRHGGPDGGGYYYIDSDDDAQNAPVFEWIDISGIGVPVSLTDDQNQGPFDMGMTFRFYGNDFNSVRICSNGWVSFTSTVTTYSNTSIPSGGEPNNLLALFWDDMNPTSGGHVYYYSDTANRRFIVSYDGVPFYSNYGAVYMQVILSADGNIFYQYQSMDGGTHGLLSATVGIENATGTIGTQYLYNQAGIHNEMAIYFGLTPPIFADHDVRPSAFVSPPAFGRVGNPITPVVTFFNNGTAAESFPVRLTIDHNGEVYNQTQQITNLNPAAPINVTFPNYTPPEQGTYLFVATSELVGDEIPANDTLRLEYNAFSNIYYEDFEASDGGFVGDNDWEWGAPTSGPNGAHSGTNVWATILGGNYTVGPLLSALVTPPFALSDNAVLTYWQWFNVESGFDGGNLKISTDAGGSWELIFPENGYNDTLSTSFRNPIGGEPAFSGNSQGWVLATFSLAAYGGASAMIKFDFGSDNSVAITPGWYIDDFTIIGGGGVSPGWVGGTVTDAASGNPLAGAIVAISSRRDTADAGGNYLMEINPGTYTMVASALYHNSLTVPNVIIVEGDTTVQSFALTAPIIQINTTPIDTSISIGDSVAYVRSLSNTGNGPLDFAISINMGAGASAVRPRVEVKRDDGNINSTPEQLSSTNAEYAPSHGVVTPGSILDFGDEVFTFDPQTPANDVACLGVEFDGTNFWVTGRHPSDEVHKLHKYDRDGNYIESFNQGTSTTWGWRDLAWDGTYLYGSDENELAVIDPAIGQKVATLPMPTSITPPMRALAWDPETDHFWSANFSSNIIEFTRTGQTVHSYPNTLSIYGMAWDAASPDGPWLWIFSQDGTPATMVSQFDPRTGSLTGVTFFAIDHNGGSPDIAGGACFTTEWNPAFGILFCLVQGTATGSDSFDLVQGYEITPYSQWLSVDPMSGTIQPGGMTNLRILVDFSGPNIVPDSTYHATIVIGNNSAQTPSIPVTAIARPVGIDEENSNLPREFGLYQNFPNPFNPATEIRFTLPVQSDVKLEVYNLLGQKVATLVNGLVPAGFHSVTWNGGDAASGVYFYKLTAGDFQKVHQMTLLK